MALLLDNRQQAAILSGGTSSNQILRSVIEVVETLDNRLLACCDLGSGTGQLIALLSKLPNIASVVGLDLVEHGSSSVNTISSDLNSDFPCASDSFDLLTAVEVIEHLENPRHFARECSRLLKPNGILILTTPNIESFRSLISLWARGTHGAFGDREYPAHITPMLATDTDRVLDEAGISVLAHRYSNPGALPHFTRWKWPKRWVVGSQAKRFSDGILVVGKKVGCT
ncbi:MAG: methyltransferase domain-containing protein [Acidimicrobiia bacterium]|nr:methyltransferase domain-containing protein [Acidimicrobiia bacterium]